jgi:hypothetical protein
MRRIHTNALLALVPRSRAGARRDDHVDPESHPIATGPELHVDDLQLRDAIIGDGVVLEESGTGDYALYEVSAGIASEVGRFRGAAPAWRALDMLDDALAS